MVWKYFPVILVALYILVPVLSAAQEDLYAAARTSMVDRQIESRGVEDPATLRALRTVERHRFVPQESRHLAYDDRPLPIGYGQTISQPYIVAYMTEIIQPAREQHVLEIGTGSGYQAAVLAEIVDSVYTVEIVPELHAAAEKRLADLGYHNVEAIHADGYFGWEAHAPFDAIVVTAAAEFIPKPLTDQLRDGGRMIIPVGSPFMVQELILVTKSGGKVKTKKLMPVRFVPFTRGE
jgi:protein-L-isoaspartate(D-aspartate) O-methyltransferase